VVAAEVLDMSDSEISALVDQAARNLETLEALARQAGDLQDRARVQELRQRLESLRRAYVRETDALTQEVIARAIERRTTRDRRGEGRRAMDARPSDGADGSANSNP
jgi:hypothetical protein